jgi:aminomethyltransferase
METPAKHTPLTQEHLKCGGKMVVFAGYSMPVEYEGIKTEHLWTRTHAGLFDVSHMGQGIFSGKEIDLFLNTITPSNFTNLALHKAKYTVLTNEQGGIIDDCIITKLDDEHFFIVYNAGCKEKDIAWITKQLPSTIDFRPLPNHALIALQGPDAATVLQALFPQNDLIDQPYMGLQVASFESHETFISRLGYTGEDGFEISIPSVVAPLLWTALLSNPNVKPIGLGARDSLRLEAGYPLYGHDLDDTTSPIEANLSWLVRKKDAHYIGGDRIAKEILQSPTRLRVGITLIDRGIAREGISILNKQGDIIGHLTSGGFGPTVNGAIAQGYLDSKYCPLDTEVYLLLRGKKLQAKVSPLCFIQTKTKSLTTPK